MPHRTSRIRFVAASLFALTLAALGIRFPVLAQSRPPVTDTRRVGALRMLDARVNYPNGFRQAVAARPGLAAAAARVFRSEAAGVATALGDLKRTMPGLDAKISLYTGGPESVQNKSGALTEAAPGASSEAIVRGFLAQHGAVYGLSDADLADLVVLGDSPGGSSGLRMLRMEQQIGGRPIFQSESRFTLDRDGRLVKSVGRLVPHARSFAPAQAGSLEAVDAIVRLLAADGKQAEAGAFAPSGDSAGWLQFSESDEFVAGNVHARPVLFPLAPGVLVPAWSVVMFTSGDQDWYAVVDADTGALLWRKNIRAYQSAHDARFRVYVQADGKTPADNPAPQSPTTALTGGGTQFPEISPSIVSMHAVIDLAASPNGWINDCPGPGGVCSTTDTNTSSQQTVGNNVRACLDRTVGGAATNVCDTDAGSVLDAFGKPTGNPDSFGRNRDFLGLAPRDFQTGYIPPPQGGAGGAEVGQTATGAGASGTLAVDQFRRGVVTQLFYVANWYHDVLYSLGFDEASANFQQTNFSGFGAGGDRVLADAQDGSGTNNANFATPPDGISGRAQMFRFTFPTIDRDGDLDSEILIHELTHGTSNRLIGNGAGLNWDPAAGMGEGWSDFYALSLLNNTNADNPNSSYAAGSYATYKLAGLLDNYVYGIRRFPYNTNNSINPMTWADVDDVTNNLSGGIAASPITFNNNGGMEVHNSGEIWALSLWEVRSRIIANPAGANGDVPAGNTTMLQLVTDAMKMTPVDPSFIEGRNALFDADCTTNACANEESIWAGFADRGLGYGAKAPFTVAFGYTASHMGISESFSSPFLDVVNPATDVTVNDAAANNNGFIDPGEAVKLTVRLTNPWRAASKAVTAGASATLSTTTPGVTIHDNASIYGAIAPLGTATGDTFTISVAPGVLCGSAIDFTLSVTSNLGTTVTTFRRRVGAASGTDPVVTYTRNTTPDLAIPDGRPLAVFDQLTITDDLEIADLDFRADSVTHTWTGDLSLMLRSPGGVGVDSISLIGGLAADQGSGDNLTNMVVDDEVASSAANDMVQATAAAAPFTKSWRPVFNAPWTTIAGFPLPDPVGTLSRYDRTSTAGTWSVAASDQFSTDTGTLNAWSMLVTPVHFNCTAFVPSAAVSATKTVSGALQVGGTVTYTVVLTNNGTASQADNPGNEFSDVLPGGLTLVSATATSGTAAAVVATNTVTWNGSVAPLGGTVTITITATVNAGTQGTTISNQGTVSYDADNNGSNETNGLTDDPGVVGTANPTAFLVAHAVVTGTKTVAGTFAPNGSITYTVVLSNTGSAAQPDNPGNEFLDVLSSSLTLVSASATSGTAVANVGTNTVTWNGAIAAAGSVTITINATIKVTSGGLTVSNQGTFAYDADVNGTNEASGVTDDPGVGGAADPTSFLVLYTSVTGTKTVTGTFQPNGAIVYTVVLTNTGNAPQADTAGSPEFTDVLPSSLTIVSASATSGTTGVNVGTNSMTWNGAIAAAGTVTISINATVKSTSGGLTVSNQGGIQFDLEGNGSNETSALTDDPGVAGANNPTVFNVACPTITVSPTSVGPVAAGTAINQTFTQTGGIGAVTFALTGALPTGVTFVNGVLSGTPTQTGSFPVTITATDANGCTGNITLTIQVTCPTITVSPTSVAPVAAGTAINQTFTAAGGVGAVTFALTGTLPTGVTFSNGVLSGTPTQTGSFPITVTATDANGCTGTVTLTIQVTCPTITVSPTSVAPVTAGTAINHTFTAAGAVGAVTFALTGALPTGVTFANGVLSGTPTQSGNFPVTVTATDANGCTGAVTLTLQVTCPTITIAPTSLPALTQSLAFTQTFTATGGAGATTFALTGTLPTGLTFSAGGVLSGTPTQVGSFPVTITATRSGCSGGLSLTIVVQSAAPTLTINTPGGGSSFSPTSSFVTITGTAKDDGTVTKVSWVNSLGGSGDATLGAIVPDRADAVETEPAAPTTVSWSAVIPLQSGVNTLTFTATNDKGISASQATTANLNTLLYGLSEGVTGTFFDTFMLVANPTATPAPLTLTYLKEDGTTATDARVVPPTTRITIPTRTLSGLSGATFAPTVLSTSAVPVIIERSTFWDASFYAGGVAQAQDPGTLWYFAEGSQQVRQLPGASVRGFDSYLLIGNGNNQAAALTARFYTEGGVLVTRNYVVNKLTRQTIFLGSIPELAGTGFGMEVVSDVPVTVERSMYFGPGFQGGHVSSGLPALSTAWVHPEGATGPFFDTYFLLLNPGATAATVTMTYRLEDGTVIPVTRVVPAGSRLTVNAETDDPRLAFANFWTSITSTQPIAAERSMYWPDGLGSWIEGHCSGGIALPGTKWGLAEGAVGGPLGFQTFYLLANPSSTAAAVTIRFLRGDGTTLDRIVTVPALSRLTYYVNKEVAALVDESFGALITSTNGVPIAVERSLYWKAKGQTFGGGSNATAVRVP